MPAELTSPLPERVIRVFVSSTFHDMQQEREILIKRIFPQLRKLCEERAVTWTEVDLRWGIPTEVEAECKVLSLCLAEIERCRPWFIGLLGDRYGWVPEDDYTGGTPTPDSQQLRSVTELEILHGALHDPQSRDLALFYFRDPRYLHHLPPGTDPANFVSESADAAAHLARLKNRIRAEHAAGRLRFAPRENYENPDALGEQVLADCTAIIDNLYPVREVPGPLDQEAARQEAYAQRRRVAFVGREKLLEHLSQHVASSLGPLVLTGDSGCGKSALLAQWVPRWSASHADDFLLQHYVGGTPQGDDWQELARRVAGELKRAFAIPDDLPHSPDTLRTALYDWFAKVAGLRRVVLILDGLDKISGEGAAGQLGWLPLTFPPNVTVLVSASPGEVLDVLRHRGWLEIPVPIFDRSDLAAVAEAYFRLFGKQPPKSLPMRLEATPAARNPLFLRTVLDELRQFGKYEQLKGLAEHYLSAPDLPMLFDRILTRWHEDFGNPPGHPDIVRRALCMITCARFGLSESEILNLLGNNGEPLPHRYWTPLYLATENALVARSGLLAPGHEYFRNAIMHRWLCQPEDLRCCRQELAAHFASIEGATDRKLDELPSLLRDLERWQPLAELLSDAQVFLRLRSTDRWVHELHRLWIPLRQRCDAGDFYRQMLARAEAADPESDLLLPLLNEVARFHEESAEYALAEPLFKRLLAMAEERRSGPAAVTTALHNLAMVLIATGRLDEAEVLCRRTLEIAQTNHGLNGSAFADSLSSLAALFEKMDRLSVANVLYCRALAIEEAAFGVDDPALSNIRSKLAHVLHRMGDFSEAESLIRGTLATGQSSLGLNHPIVATRLNTLASILEDTNRAQEAEPLMRRALEIEEASFGPDHPNVASSLNNLAILLAKTNRVSEAERLHRRSLKIRERLLGPDHPDLAHTLSNLAKILQTNNRLHEAEPLYRRALEIEEAHHGPRHTGVAATLNNLAELLRIQNRLVEAEPLFRRALQIRIELLGDDHHLVAESRNNLALLLRFANCLEEAEHLYREALRGYEASFGPDHPEVAVVLCNLAGLLRSTNRLDEVEDFYRRALKIVEDSFGPDHPKIAMRLNNFAVYLKQVGREDEAEAMYRRALEIREKSYGPDHPEVADVLSNLGILLRDANRLDEAEALLRRALAIDERSSDENHPTLAIRLCNLADLRLRANHPEEAWPLQQRAVKILLRASADNRRKHPELIPALATYANLLSALGKSPQSVMNHIDELILSYGSTKPH